MHSSILLKSQKNSQSKGSAAKMGVKVDWVDKILGEIATKKM